MNYEIIKALAKSKNLSIKNIGEIIGMTDSGLYTAFINNSLKVDTLEKIANALGVSPCYFFEGQERQAQEEKFEYLKDEVIKRGDISFDLHTYLEVKFTPKSGISDEFMKYLEKYFTDKEQDEVLNATKLTPTQIRVNFKDYREGRAIWFLNRIRDAVVLKGKPDLTEAYKNEIRRCFAQLASEAMSDYRLMFLLKEGLIEKKWLLAELAKHIHSTLELTLNDALVEHLCNYFSPTEINEVLFFMKSK